MKGIWLGTQDDMMTQNYLCLPTALYAQNVTLICVLVGWCLSIDEYIKIYIVLLFSFVFDVRYIFILKFWMCYILIYEDCFSDFHAIS